MRADATRERFLRRAIGGPEFPGFAMGAHPGLRLATDRPALQCCGSAVRLSRRMGLVFLDLELARFRLLPRQLQLDLQHTITERGRRGLCVRAFR